MLLYNVTVKIDHSVHQDWLQWMKEIHIPEVMATGQFTENRMWKLLHMDESDGVTYAIQYVAPSAGALEIYQRDFAPRLQQEHQDRYNNKFVAMRTLMEKI